MHTVQSVQLCMLFTNYISLFVSQSLVCAFLYWLLHHYHHNQRYIVFCHSFYITSLLYAMLLFVCSNTSSLICCCGVISVCCWPIQYSRKVWNNNLSFYWLVYCRYCLDILMLIYGISGAIINSAACQYHELLIDGTGYTGLQHRWTMGCCWKMRALNIVSL
jgi:hypothetical protein